MAEEAAQAEPIAQEEMAPEGGVAMDGTYEQEGVPYGQITRRTKAGFVGAPPSSLAALATGKKYLSDPLTPVTPRPNVRAQPAPPWPPPSPPARDPLLLFFQHRGSCFSILQAAPPRLVSPPFEISLDTAFGNPSLLYQHQPPQALPPPTITRHAPEHHLPLFDCSVTSSAHQPPAPLSPRAGATIG